MSAVPCIYPDHECEPDGRAHDARDGGCAACGAIPQDGEGWRTTSLCTHRSCVEVEGFRLEYEREKARRLTPGERAAIAGDRELFRDEFHGDRDALDAA